MKDWIPIIVMCFFGIACETIPNPQIIIDQAIEAHGGYHYDPHTLSFGFRNKQYSTERSGGSYTYSRSFSDSTGQITDVLTNDGFTRMLNNKEVELDGEWKSRYSASVNSVIYFAMLPYGLNDPAVQKKFLRTESIKDVSYDLVEVTFQEEGGGEDFQDVFYYWINKADHTLDYLAYSYDESDGKGIRFREAINPRVVNGIRMQDYVNYKPQEIVPMDELKHLFEKGKLKELSRIELVF